MSLLDVICVKLLGLLVVSSENNAQNIIGAQKKISLA
jgi:hypothetical protein